MIKAIAGIVLLGLIVLSGFLYFRYSYVISEGTREGVLLKISKKGIVFKTYECELVQMGFRSAAGNISSNNFKFSVQDPKVAKQLEDATGKNVKVHYHQYQNSLPWRGDNYDGQNTENGQYIVDQLVAVSDVPVQRTY